MPSLENRKLQEREPWGPSENRAVMDTVQLTQPLLTSSAGLFVLPALLLQGSRFARAVEAGCSFHSWLDRVPANLTPAELGEKERKQIWEAFSSCF